MPIVLNGTTGISTTELSTSAVRTSGEGYATPLDTELTTAGWAIAGMIGAGQTWTDVTGSRALATTYTNSTGRPIMVSATITGTGAGVSSAILTVAGVIVMQAVTTESNGTSWNGVGTPFQAIVPDGATYSISNNTLTNTITRWSELR